MGKRRMGFKNVKGGVNRLKNAASDEDDDKIENDLENLLDDEIGRYNNFKDDDELEQAQKGKKKKKNKHKLESDDEEEQEIFGIDVPSGDEDGGGKDPAEDDEDDDEDMDSEEDNDDDILDGSGDDDGIPDIKAWGKKARAFHSTDYVDPDFGGFEGNDAEMAEQEELEAKEIQSRLMAELDENDFFGFLPNASGTEPSKDSAKSKNIASSSKEIIKMDFDSLSATEKRKLVERECPEVIHLLDEYQEKLQDLEEITELLKGEHSDFIKKFYETKYHTILNYCINISYFLYLRASNPAYCKGHPVIKRMLQFRRLLEELAQFNPEKFKKAELKASKNNLDLLNSQNDTLDKMNKVNKSSNKMVQFDNEDEKESGDEELSESEEMGDPEKRGITYEMSKNKGLTPHRKKEQRNPRVKHRMKFRKANIRRKGQVRKPRTEKTKYTGESTGINPNVRKSIRLK